MSDKPNDRSSEAFSGRGGESPPELPNEPKDPRELLGGYATGTLTESELQYLMSAALEDQALFDELQDEIALKQALEAPGVRQRLLATLDEDPARAGAVPQGTVTPAAQGTKPGWFRWQWGAVGLAAAALAVLTVVLLVPPARNTQVAQLETQPAAQLEAPTESQELNVPESNEVQTAERGIAAVPSTPIPGAVNGGREAPVPQAEVRAADARDRAGERNDTATAEPAAAEAPPRQVAVARSPAPIAPPPPPTPSPTPLLPATRTRSAADAAQEAVTGADQVAPQRRAGQGQQGTVSQFAAGNVPGAVENLVFNGQPVLQDLLRRAGPTGFAYQIVDRTLVVVPSENGYLTVTEGAAGDDARAALATEQQVMSRAPVTIALGTNDQVTISFSRRQGAPAVEAQPGEGIRGAVALPVGEDRRVTVTLPR